MTRNNIVLSGFMASGKTTVGRLLSNLTGKKLVDTDQLIEEEASMSIPEIFEKEGEEFFRGLERKVIMKVASRQDRVIALGGGAVLDPRNVADLKRGGVIYLLEVTPDEVDLRAGALRGRPLLSGDREEMEKLLREREKAYVEAADMVLDTSGRSPDEIAGEILKDFEMRTSEKQGENP